MKKVLFGILATAAAAFSSAPALAADMPLKTPSPAPAPTYSWTGFYVGVNAGYGWKDPSVHYIPNDPGALATTCGGSFGGTCIPPASFTIGGAVGGGQVGYNWQFDQHWLAGFEADYDAARIKGTGNSIFTISGPIPGADFQATEKIGSFGTVRARFGWLPTNDLLIFGTGGLAYGHVTANANLNNAAGANISVLPVGGGSYGYACTTNINCFSGTNSETAVGWTIGGGGEFAISSNISIKAEFLYVDLGHALSVDSVAGNAGGNAVASSFSAGFSRLIFNVARAGMNYKF